MIAMVCLMSLSCHRSQRLQKEEVKEKIRGMTRHQGRLELPDGPHYFPEHHGLPNDPFCTANVRDRIRCPIRRCSITAEVILIMPLLGMSPQERHQARVHQWVRVGQLQVGHNRVPSGNSNQPIPHQSHTAGCMCHSFFKCFTPIDDRVPRRRQSLPPLTIFSRTTKKFEPLLNKWT